MVLVDGVKYEIIKNYRNAFNEGVFLDKCTEYFYDYDYIVGDISYNMLRLKGFYDNSNKKVNKINNFKDVDEYLKNYCANDCRYFILKKIGE